MADPLLSAFLNIEAFYRQVYWGAPTATTVRTDRYTLSYSGVGWLHSVNQLWLHSPAVLEETYLRLATRFFRRYDAEYSIVFTEPLMDGVAAWLRDGGYSERLSTPILMLDGLPRPRYIGSEAQIVRAGVSEQHDLLHVMYSAFYIGPEIARCIVRPEQFDDPATRHYVLYVAGEPVCCATVLLSGGVAGVWNVGTLRGFRRRGLASALLVYALTEAAADGYSLSVLLASPMGRPLYEEMGYRAIGSTVFYGPTPG